MKCLQILCFFRKYQIYVRLKIVLLNSLQLQCRDSLIQMSSFLQLLTIFFNPSLLQALVIYLAKYCKQPNTLCLRVFFLVFFLKKGSRGRQIKCTHCLMCFEDLHHDKAHTVVILWKKSIQWKYFGKNNCNRANNTRLNFISHACTLITYHLPNQFHF